MIDLRVIVSSPLSHQTETRIADEASDAQTAAANRHGRDVANREPVRTRVMGFRAVATHDVGELRCASRRITMVLDLRSAYERPRASGNWMYRYLTRERDAGMHARLAA